jgi:DNA-binding MarR family transcriptional regulator
MAIMREESLMNTKEYKTKSTETGRIVRMLESMKQDQIEAKNRIGRLVLLTKQTSNSSDNDWFSFIDYGKVSDVKLCLVNCSGNLTTNRGIINYDLNNIISKCGFNEEELEILKHYRAGQTQKEIREDLNKEQSIISKKIDGICNRIVRQHLEERYDNLRLNVIKGKYKRCSNCNEIKFEKEFYPTRNVCKPCFNSKK